METLLQNRFFRLSLVAAGLLFLVGILSEVSNTGSVWAGIVVGLFISVPVVFVSAALIWAMSPKV